LSNLQPYVDRLRQNYTEAEQYLWGFLSAKKLNGLKFRRQHAIGNFIVDFLCESRRVVVELDGGMHLNKKTQDFKRDEWLEKLGYTVLRFSNEEVFEDIHRVLTLISKYCNLQPSL
jgi:very-short-patch-repair endonuclease